MSEWHDSDDTSVISAVLELIDDELYQALYKKWCNTGNEPNYNIFNEVIFSEDGIFQDFIVIEHSTREYNAGPMPTSCYGPWHDVIYNYQVFSVYDSDIEFIHEKMKEMLEMSTDEFNQLIEEGGY
jgi:hypothetical protein